MSNFVIVLLVMAGCVVGTAAFFLGVVLICERISLLRRPAQQDVAEMAWDEIETGQL